MSTVKRVRVDQPYVPTRVVETNRRSALRLVHQMLAMSGLTDKHHREQLSLGLWKWTESEGVPPYAKFNTRYISMGVKSGDPSQKVNHEHVWTRAWLVQRLLSRIWAEDALRSFLETYGQACIVTTREHAALSGSKKEGWQRYADARVGVWDRQLGCWLDVSTGIAAPDVRTDVAPPSPGPEIAGPDVRDLIRRLAKPSAVSGLERFVKIAGWQYGIAVPSYALSAEPANYFRIHDTFVGEPTRAAAFPHWTGRVAFGLLPDDLTPQLMRHPFVSVIKHKTYGITCSVSDDDALDVAADLLALALEKVRRESGAL